MVFFFIFYMEKVDLKDINFIKLFKYLMKIVYVCMQLDNCWLFIEVMFCCYCGDEFYVIFK